MIPLDEAQEFVLGSCSPTPPEMLALDLALECVVAADVVATEAIPPFTNSSMDGYALRADDTKDAPVRLKVIGTILAGHPLDRSVSSGQAARIMTGAPVPDGADAVCMLEESEVDETRGFVTISRTLPPGNFVRQPGQDVRAGDVIAASGTTLTPAHLGVLANQGIDEVWAHRRPTVGVLSTGDELFTGVGELPPGKIRDANRHTLLALSRREGWNCFDLGIVGDDEAALVKALSDGAEQCDALITSGGVSVGDLDLIRVVLEKLSAGSMRWMQIAIRPAKPFAFGVLADSGTPVFGLPGNPVSAMVSFELFVRPALRLLSGHSVLHRTVVRARSVSDLHRQSDGKLHLLRASLSVDEQGAWLVSTTGQQESHQLHAMSEANALVLLPDGAGVNAGATVDVLVVDPGQLLNRTHRTLLMDQTQRGSS
jgi:molybdopterin molybdotransferase